MLRAGNIKMGKGGSGIGRVTMSDLSIFSEGGVAIFGDQAKNNKGCCRVDVVEKRIS